MVSTENICTSSKHYIDCVGLMYLKLCMCVHKHAHIHTSTNMYTCTYIHATKIIEKRDRKYEKGKGVYGLKRGKKGRDVIIL